MTDKPRSFAAIMLDQWADPAMHAIHVATGKDLGGDYESRAVCSCGWRSIPFSWDSQARREECPVLEALRERAGRMVPDVFDR